MAASAPNLSDVIADGRWLAHRYEEDGDNIHFRFVPKDVQRRLTFLTDQEIGDVPAVIFPRAECLAEVRRHTLSTPRLIFHSAYCCSTLLARAFDIPEISFGLKEPQILNDVAGLQLRAGDPRQVAAAMDIALLLLARPLEPGEVSVIKPSNLLNPMISLVTAMRPDLKGLLLHAPLDVFLASIARKEIEGRMWVRELMWKLIRVGQAARFGFNDEELYRQTDLQAGAAAWLAQQGLFAEAAINHHGFRTLNSEILMARPVETLAAAAALFELDINPQVVVDGAAFRTHSKDRRDYSAEQREEDRNRGQSLHEREIGIVLEWSRRLAEHAGISMQLPSPLLS